MPDPGAGDEDTRQGDDDVPGCNAEPDPGAGNEDNQQGNDDVLGCNAEPNDVPGGPNDWLLDDLVPHLEVLRLSTEFIDMIQLASLDNNLIPSDARERLRAPTMEPPYVDADLRMCIEIFLETMNGSQVTYNGICQAI